MSKPCLRRPIHRRGVQFTMEASNPNYWCDELDKCKEETRFSVPPEVPVGHRKIRWPPDWKFRCLRIELIFSGFEISWKILLGYERLIPFTIHPLIGPFRYFVVLIDGTTRWSHVCLLSNRNHAFARFITQIIKLRAHYLDNPIKFIGMDNAAKFSSKAFNDYCMAQGINVEHLVPYIHTQEAESLNKRGKLIARPLLRIANYKHHVGVLRSYSPRTWFK